MEMLDPVVQRWEGLHWSITVTLGPVARFLRLTLVIQSDVASHVMENPTKSALSTTTNANE